MNAFFRIIAALGALFFALSFVLPPHFYNSPGGRFEWALDAAFPVENWGESLVFVGVALVIAYPYLWSLLTAASLLYTGSKHGKLILRSQLLCHLGGGVIVTALGVLLLALHDTFLPVSAQVTAAVFPLLFFSALLATVSAARPSRRLPAVAAVGMIPFIPLQLVLAHEIMFEYDPAWGFILGAAGAAVCVAGSLVVLFRS